MDLVFVCSWNWCRWRWSCFSPFWYWLACHRLYCLIHKVQGCVRMTLNSFSQHIAMLSIFIVFNFIGSLHVITEIARLSESSTVERLNICNFFSISDCLCFPEVCILVPMYWRWHISFYLSCEISCALFQVMPCMHCGSHWKLHLISSQAGTQIKLTLALGSMLLVTVIIMLFLCKILFNVLFPYLNHIMLDQNVSNKSLILWFVQVSMLYLLILIPFVWSMLTLFFSCRSLSSIGFSGTLSPQIGNIKTLTTL